MFLALGAFFFFSGLTNANPPTKILVVGDSHTTGSFKDGLVEKLDAQWDLKSTIYASCGSSPEHWLSEKTPRHRTSCGYYERNYERRETRASQHATPEFKAVIEQTDPRFVIIAMGTNQLGQASGTAEKNIRKMMEMAVKGGRKCIWVGPPRVGPRAVGAEALGSYYTLLKRVARGTCVVLDSRDWTDAVNAEKKYFVHYPGKPGADWGRAAGQAAIEAIRVGGPTGAVSPPDRTHLGN